MKYIKQFEAYTLEKSQLNYFNEKELSMELDNILNDINEKISYESIIAKLESWFYKGINGILNAIKNGGKNIANMINKLYSYIKNIKNTFPIIYKSLCMMLLTGILVVSTSMATNASTTNQNSNDSINIELNNELNELLHIASGLSVELDLQNFEDLDIINALTEVKDQMLDQGNNNFGIAIDAANLNADLKKTIEELYMNAEFLQSAADKTGNKDIQKDAFLMAKKGAKHMMSIYLGE